MSNARFELPPSNPRAIAEQFLCGSLNGLGNAAFRRETPRHTHRTIHRKFTAKFRNREASLGKASELPIRIGAIEALLLNQRQQMAVEYRGVT